jgi:diketogulonate reductase-like aldo/keto reductase
MKTVQLANGETLPLLGVGTWKVTEHEDVARVVHNSLKIGYRHLDCAAIYKNETLIGAALKKSMRTLNVERKDLFITSKVWNTNHTKEHVRQACENTLKQLQLDYLDLYLVHWPIAWEYTGVDLSIPCPRDEITNEIKFAKVTLQETWQAMEELVDAGLVKSIGVSNYSYPLLLDLLSYARIKPVVNQVEIHPYLPQTALVEASKKIGIHTTAYRPMAYGGSTGVNLFEDPIIAELGKKYNRSPAQIILAWNFANGTSAIPKTISHLQENFESQDLDLDAEDVLTITNLNRNLRLSDKMKTWFIPIFN